jgi:hypothetical protein
MIGKRMFRSENESTDHLFLHGTRGNIEFSYRGAVRLALIFALSLVLYRICNLHCLLDFCFCWKFNNGSIGHWLSVP